MRQFQTKGIVLARTDYGEADRIITFLTPDHGKVKAYARGVRKSKSKLAGGIELFSVSDISLVIGRGEINTLISTRLIKHYGNIVKDIERTNLTYELMRRLNKATEEEPEAAYFNLLRQAFEVMDNFEIRPELIELWFNMQLLRIGGHTPNLRSDINDEKLSAHEKYDFDFERMRFLPAEQGPFKADEIKFLRLGFAAQGPKVLQRVKNADKLVSHAAPAVLAMLSNYIRI